MIKKNLLYSAFNFILIYLLKFGVRLAFVRSLSLEYLGINGLFTELLTMLSLVELGIGPSIVYSLYKPLANRDIRQTTALMQLFKKVYHAIGGIIFGLGLLLYPWLEYLVKEVPSVPHWKLFYLVFLFNAAISYLWSYQRSLLSANQKQYVVNAYEGGVQTCVALVQIILLLTSHSYLLFLAAMVLGTVVENLLLNRRARQDCPLLQEKLLLQEEAKREIIKNVKALLVHKFTGVMVLSSTNIILAKLVGLAAVGLCSNYLFVTNAITNLVGKLCGSLTATVGHKLIIDNKEESQALFNKMQLAVSAVASLSAVGLFTLLNPFVELWLGKEYLLPELTVGLLVAYFYLHFLRRIPLIFRDAAGLYYEDRLKSIAELVLNLVLGWLLVQRYGIAGIFLAGLISTLCTCLWAEPFIVFKYALGLSLKKYLLKAAGFSVLTCLCALVWKYLYYVILGNTVSLLSFVGFGLAIVLSMSLVWGLLWRRLYRS